MTIKRKRENEINSTALVVLTKNPILGFAKTRIAKKVGNIQALNIYEELIHITQDHSGSVDFNLHVFYSNFIDTFDRWPATAIKHLQLQSSDLGERIAHAISTALLSSKKVLVIGSDCPYISPELLTRARSKLDDNDIVIGPSFDGGFYLLGLKMMHSNLFEDVAWSTSNVCAQLLSNCNGLSLTTMLLERLHDIDEIEDWDRYQKK